MTSGDGGVPNMAADDITFTYGPENGLLERVVLDGTARLDLPEAAVEALGELRDRPWQLACAGSLLPLRRLQSEQAATLVRDRLDLRDIVVRNTPADDPNGQATISGGRKRT